MARLSLHYNDAVPDPMIDHLEHHARRLGIPLEAVERMGQDLQLVEEFVVAAEAGRGIEFAYFVIDKEPPAAAVRDEDPAPVRGARGDRRAPGALRHARS